MLMCVCVRVLRFVLVLRGSLGEFFFEEIRIVFFMILGIWVCIYFFVGCILFYKIRFCVINCNNMKLGWIYLREKWVFGMVSWVVIIL